MPRPLITVFGATGTQGGSLARALLAPADRAFRVRAVTRCPGGAAAQALSDLGAEIFAADLDDAPSVERALCSAYGAFCVTSVWAQLSPERVLSQAEAMAAAAQRVGLRHVIWSTAEDRQRFLRPGAGPTTERNQHCSARHLEARGEADQCFIRRGLPLTLLLASFCWEDLNRFGMLRRCAADGTLELVLPMGDALLPGIAARDIGACAAALFALGDAAVGRRVGISGEHLSGAQMAAALTEALGEPVRHAATAPLGAAAPGVAGDCTLADMFRFERDFNAEVRALRDVRATRALHPGLQDFANWLASSAAGLRSTYPLA